MGEHKDSSKTNGNLETIVQTMTDIATQLIGAEFGSFFYNVTTAQGDAFMLFTLSGVERSKFESFPLPRATSLFAPTFRGEGILRADDVLAHPLYGKNEPHFGMPSGHLPVRSYLAVPVVSRAGKVHGGLFLGHGKPGMFTESHEKIVGAIAVQAALAIDAAELYESARVANLHAQRENQSLVDQMKSSERQFQQLVAGVTDCAIYMLDPNGFVTTWNPGAERIKGYTAAEIIGQHLSTFYTEEDRARNMPQQVLDAARTQGKYEAEAWRVRKDGTRFWASILLDPIRDASGAVVGFAKITRDMTERRAIQEQLHQAQKMEAIGQLTGGVAHDFNNLLTVILGNLETLSRRLPAEDPRSRRALDQATRGAQRAATLTSQLLAFSRRQPLNPKPTDLNRLVVGISDLMQRTLGENVSVETVLGAGLWRVEVDAHQLESALINLAVNARDAMPNGGKLTVETANAHIDDAYTAQYAEISPGQYVVICVSDTGAGMTKEVMARAFEPFFTTKPLGQGTGLGLSQVFGFVKQSGGHVKLYSEVGEGTTVKIYLPRSFAGSVVEPEAAPIEPVGDPCETILVVEDDNDVRNYSTESLRELGFSVLEAPDATTALRLLERHPEINLLFTDVGLPGLNGRELVDTARCLRPGLPVLFTTGYARNAIVHQGRLDIGVRLLTKPFGRAELGAAIRDTLDTWEKTPTGKSRALIVEDEPLIRMFLIDVLGDLGFDALPTTNGRDALSTAERVLDLDVAFVDVGLPDRSGMEVAAELRARWPSLKIVIASGYGEQVDARFASDSGVTSLAKPFDADTIAATLTGLGFTVASAT